MTFLQSHGAPRMAPSRGERGFTLVELLVTIIIILLLSLVVATGVPAAVRTYQRAVTASNAEILLGTATVRLRDELGVADPDTVTSTGDSITFTSAENRLQTTLTFSDLQLTRSELQPGGSAISTTPLVPVTALPEGAYTDLKLTCSGISYSKGIFTVSRLRVVPASGGTETVSGAEFNTFQVRTLATA